MLLSSKTRRRASAVIVVTLGCFTLLFGFQNCGGFKSNIDPVESGPPINTLPSGAIRNASGVLVSANGEPLPGEYNCQYDEVYFSETCVQAAALPAANDAACNSLQSDLQIAVSDDQNGRQALIRAGYCIVLGRAADAPSAAAWLDYLNKNELTRETFITGLLNAAIESGEMGPASPWLNEHYFVSARSADLWAFYHFLGRGPEQEGFDYWLLGLEPLAVPTTAHVKELITGFVTGDEFRARYPVFRNPK